jgi:hypothetical protein
MRFRAVIGDHPLLATIIELGATARRPAPLSLIEKGTTAT